MLRLTEHADVSSDATCKEALPQTGREGLLFFYFSFCSVARWDATFCSFRGIGEGGTAFPRESWSRGGGPCGPRYARGQRPLCTPLVGAQLPRPQRAGAPPRAPGSFRFTTKGTKGVPGALPLDPVGGHYHPPSSAPRCSPRKGRVPLRVAGFATLRWCEQLAFLSPEAPSGKHPLLSNRGAGITGAECVSCVGFVSSLCQGIWLN